jgi:putative transposase
MRNHFHLLVRTPRANLQEFMRHFNISYTSSFNRAHHRSGHLYQGRYTAFLIDADNYILEVSRYLQVNPVRTRAQSGLTDEEKRAFLTRYAWSSYPGCISLAHRHPWISYEILDLFGGDTVRGRTAYRRFVERGIARKIQNPMEKGRGHGIVGDQPFIEKVSRLVGDGPSSREVPALRKIRVLGTDRVIALLSGQTGIAPETLLSRGYTGVERGLLMELLYRHGGVNQRQIGERMGVDYSAVSIRRKRFVAAMENDRRLKELFASLEMKLSQE